MGRKCTGVGVYMCVCVWGWVVVSVVMVLPVLRLYVCKGRG